MFKTLSTVKIFILGCNYSETEVYWTGTKLEHLGFLGVSQFCSGPEQFCWGRIFIPIPTPPRCIVHLWAKKNRRTPRFFLTRHGYPPKTMLVRNKTGTIDDFLGCSSFVPAQNKYFYGNLIRLSTERGLGSSHESCFGDVCLFFFQISPLFFCHPGSAFCALASCSGFKYEGDRWALLCVCHHKVFLGKPASAE